jgi:hypothetical protein
VIRVRKKRNACRLLVENLVERDTFVDLGVDGKMV